MNLDELIRGGEGILGRSTCVQRFGGGEKHGVLWGQCGNRFSAHNLSFLICKKRGVQPGKGCCGNETIELYQ